EPFNSVISTVLTCNPKQGNSKTNNCSWQLGEYGGISYGTPYAVGTGLLNTGGSFNAGSYSSKKMDALIQGTETSTSPSAFTQYENYAARQVPWLWVPVAVSEAAGAPNGIIIYKKGLAGVAPINPVSVATPENYYYTK
ncbi:MAG: hypothetical protein ACRD0L_04810, partial [Acidimicrobiales bacterium]